MESANYYNLGLYRMGIEQEKSGRRAGDEQGYNTTTRVERRRTRVERDLNGNRMGTGHPFKGPFMGSFLTHNVHIHIITK